MPTEEEEPLTGYYQPKKAGCCTCRCFLITFCLLFVAVVIATAVGVPIIFFSDDYNEGTPHERAIKVLERFPLIDGHNDLSYAYRERVQNVLSRMDLTRNLSVEYPGSHTDIPRLREGRLGGQFWSCYVSCDTQYTDAVRVSLDQCDTILRFVQLYPDTFQFATTADEARAAFRAGKVASMIGLEGGHSIDSSLATLRQFYRLGVRYMTLTHTCNNPWADSSPGDDNLPTPGEHNGLTTFGKTVIREMNRIGMMVDLAHVAHKTMVDALNTSRAPVIFSHSSAYSLCNHHRNVRDDVLDRILTNGGVVMATFFTSYVNCYPNNQTITTLAQVADHIEYIRNKTGPDHVGIGGDFDGMGAGPDGLEDVSKYPDLFAELARRGWSNEDLEKLAGQNILRVMEEVERVSDLMKAEGVAPYEDHVASSSIPEPTCRPDF